MSITVKVSITEQRKLYEKYKNARLREMNLLNSLLNTGSYSRPSVESMIEDAKNDILDFISYSVFEEKIKEDVKKEMDELYK